MKCIKLTERALAGLSTIFSQLDRIVTTYKNSEKDGVSSIENGIAILDIALDNCQEIYDFIKNENNSTTLNWENVSSGNYPEIDLPVEVKLSKSNDTSNPRNNTRLVASWIGGGWVDHRGRDIETNGNMVVEWRHLSE